MTTIDLAEEIRRLSVDERIRRSEIARRIAAHKRDPSGALPWEEALATLRERYE